LAVGAGVGVKEIFPIIFFPIYNKAFTRQEGDNLFQPFFKGLVVFDGGASWASRSAIWQNIW
jgi:hypothetical protein